MSIRQYRAASDVVGKKFGRLLVERIERNRYTKAFCRCDCGGTKWVQVNKLLDEHTQSCGCLRKEKVSAANKTHGQSKSRTYAIWMAMNNRCRNRKSSDYRYYGARGIVVCERWKSFENFLADMGERPGRMEIDRINNDGNYEPGNCRWTDRKTQNRNSRHARMLTFNEKTQCVSAWAEEMGVRQATLNHRLLRGISVEVALTMPFGRWPK